jgi:putative cardiolipin synthase
LLPAETRALNDFLLTLTDPAMAAAYDLPATLFDECPVPLAGIPGEGGAGSIAPARAGRPADHGAPAGTHAGEQSGGPEVGEPLPDPDTGAASPAQGAATAGGRHRDPDQLPGQHGRALVYGAYRRHRPWLERQGVNLFELTTEAFSLHAKLILMGKEEALLGSFNLDPRSLMLNTELMLHLHSPRLCDELQQLIDGWLQQAVHPVAASPSAWRRLLAQLSDWLPLHRWL